MARTEDWKVRHHTVRVSRRSCLLGAFVAEAVLVGVRDADLVGRLALSFLVEGPRIGVVAEEQLVRKPDLFQI